MRLAALLPLFAGCAAALAQEAPSTQPTPPPPLPDVEPGDITGRTFHGLRLPLAPADGPLGFAAAIGHAWREDSPPHPDGSPALPVHRLLLQRDVKASVGPYEITATRAAVWLQRLESASGDGGEVWQVWMYLEQGGSATKAGGISVIGDRLPVQAIVRTTEPLQLSVDNLRPGPVSDSFLAEAERALARRLRTLVRADAPPPISPEELARRGLRIPPIEERPPESPSTLEEDARRLAEAARALEPTDSRAPVFAERGVFTFMTDGDIVMVGGGEPKPGAPPVESAAIFERPLIVTFWDRRRNQTVQLTAERAVVFLEPGRLTEGILAGPVDRDSIRGLYLEGDVAADFQSADGRFSLRSPRVYYSVEHDRGVLVDAVFWTYDAKRGLPLYVRAKSIEQVAHDQFTATEARITNTPFFEPDLSIGASSVTVKPAPTEDRNRRILVDAKDITLRAGGVPFFYWPRLRGDPESVPLRDLRVENSSGSGAALKTTWNLYSLLGIAPTEDVSADLLVDWYFERGPAFGTAFSWRDPGVRGGLLAYMVPDDRGTDLLVTGDEKDHDGVFRGMILGEHRAALTEEWTLFAEAAYISDETFIDGYFDFLARNRREFTNALVVRRLRENTALFGGLKANANDFIANEYLLQSPGYTVDKYPDLGYFRLADDLLPDHPGLLSYSSEYRLTEMRLHFNEVPVRNFGFRNPVRAQSLFGVTPDQSIGDALRAMGYTEEPRTRFDTRHELTMPLSAGPLNVTPFVVGRFTAYNDDFREFSPDADEPQRLWAAQGVTVSTEIHRVDNTVESRLFDLHRIRHIIQPSITLWHADSTIDRTDLPVYDDEVESLAEGTATTLALRQVWQTQRGGPGRWRSVDVFRLDTSLTISSDDVDRESPIGRFFDYRPEFSNLGDTFATVEAAWQVSEIVGIGGGTVYDFEINQPARTDFGIIIHHSPELISYLDLRYLNAQDSTTFGFGGTYELTPKYTVTANAAYDTNLGDIQSVSTEIRRRYPNVILGLGFTYNNITSETSFGFVFQPVGVTRGGTRIQGLGSAAGTTSTFGG